MMSTMGHGMLGEEYQWERRLQGEEMVMEVGGGGDSMGVK